MRVLFWSCHTLCMLYFQCVRTSSFISILYDVLWVPVMFTFIYGSIFSSGHLSSCSFPFRGGVEAVLKHHSFLASWYNKISPVLTVYVTLKKKKAVLFPIKLTLYSILFESNLYYKTQINLAHRAFYHIKKNIACLKAFFWVCSSELYKCNSPSAASSPVFNYESASTTSILLVSSSAVTFWGVHFLCSSP